MSVVLQNPNISFSAFLTSIFKIKDCFVFFLSLFDIGRGCQDIGENLFLEYDLFLPEISYSRISGPLASISKRVNKGAMPWDSGYGFFS